MEGLCQATFRRTGASPQIRRTVHPSGCYLERSAARARRREVQFRWKDYRDNSRHKTMTLVAEEFIRRFLLHVLPEGFQRIRYYGFLANRYRAEKLALCRQLLQTRPPTPKVEVKKDYRDRYEEITGVSLKTCPLCRHGTIIVIETFECTASRAPRMDTS